MDNIVIDDYISNDIFIYDQYDDSVNYELLKECAITWGKNGIFKLNRFDSIFENCNFESVFVFRILINIICNRIDNLISIGEEYFQEVCVYINSKYKQILSNTLFTENEQITNRYEIIKSLSKLNIFLDKHQISHLYEPSQEEIALCIARAVESYDYQYIAIFCLCYSDSIIAEDLKMTTLDFCIVQLQKANTWNCDKDIYSSYIMKFVPSPPEEMMQ